MTPEEREALKQEIRAEIMAEVHTAIWAAIGVHVNGPPPAVAAPIGVPIYTHHPQFVFGPASPVSVTAGGGAVDLGIWGRGGPLP